MAIELLVTLASFALGLSLSLSTVAFVRGFTLERQVRELYRNVNRLNLALNRGQQMVAVDEGTLKTRKQIFNEIESQLKKALEEK